MFLLYQNPNGKLFLYELSTDCIRLHNSSLLQNYATVEFKISESRLTERPRCVQRSIFLTICIILCTIPEQLLMYHSNGL